MGIQYKKKNEYIKQVVAAGNQRVVLLEEILNQNWIKRITINVHDKIYFQWIIW